MTLANCTFQCFLTFLLVLSDTFNNYNEGVTIQREISYPLELGSRSWALHFECLGWDSSSSI